MNRAIAITLVLASLFVYFIVPLFLLPGEPLWALLLVPFVLSAPTHWSLIHEAIHGVLAPGRATNERLGRVLAGLFGSPFQVLRLGHLMHHRFNRSPLNRAEIVERDDNPGLIDRLAYYCRLLGGLYLGELLVAPLAILPDIFYRPIIHLTFGDEAPDGRSMWAAARKQLLEEPGRARMRLDGLLITLGLALSLWCYGANWWMLVAALYGRGLLISFLDNAYHYEATLDDVMAGFNLRLPDWAAALFLNFNLHKAHHARPNAPWRALPEVMVAEGQRYHGDLATVAARQLRGPVPVSRAPHLDEALPAPG